MYFKLTGGLYKFKKFSGGHWGFKYCTVAGNSVRTPIINVVGVGLGNFTNEGKAGPVDRVCNDAEFETQARFKALCELMCVRRPSYN